MCYIFIEGATCYMACGHKLGGSEQFIRCKKPQCRHSSEHQDHCTAGCSSCPTCVDTDAVCDVHYTCQAFLEKKLVAPRINFLFLSDHIFHSRNELLDIYSCMNRAICIESLFIKSYIRGRGRKESISAHVMHRDVYYH